MEKVSVWLSLSDSVPAALPPGEFLREIQTKTSDCFSMCFFERKRKRPERKNGEKKKKKKNFG